MTNDKATPNANTMFYVPTKGNTMWPEIVKRVNSHEALLEACKDAIACLDNHIARYPMAKTELPELRAYLSQAIAQAETK